MASDNPIRTLSAFADSDVKMPALFVGHGSPMNAIEDNEFSRTWIEAGRSLPRPQAILCVSAHWETVGSQVTAMVLPRTIHDFYGFPQPLYEMHYLAPGSPALARLTQEAVRSTQVGLDYDWGLDHGAWSVLCRLFPNADIPVVQLSLDRTQDPAFHYELGKELKSLRRKGVLIVGSGNAVHNLGLVAWQDVAYDWALEFDDKIKQLILSGDHRAMIRYDQLGRAARLAVPTNEHYLPLLYTIAVQDHDEQVSFFADKVTMGSISMRSLRIG
jgi:4,5-DOPA dioxygenase extradiol